MEKTPLFFTDKLIKIPKEYSHEIENIDSDCFYVTYPNVVLSCYFNGKKDPIHHESLKNQKRDKDDFNYIAPLYNSCLKLGLHLIIFYDNLSKNFVQKYSTNKIIFRKTILVSNLSINDERFIIYYEYLLKNPYKNVYSSDIGDVFLTKNIFELFDTFDKNKYNIKTIEELQNSDLKLHVKDNGLTDVEIERYLLGLKGHSRKNFDVENIIFIGTNSIGAGSKKKTPEWFEHRKPKIEAFNKAIETYIPKYKPFVSGNFQIYNPGTIMANYNSYLCFVKKFIKFLLVSCKIRENNNWNMVIFNYICHHFLNDGYNNKTYHSKYIFTGFPFNSIYQRKEIPEKSLAYIVHK